MLSEFPEYCLTIEKGLFASSLPSSLGGPESVQQKLTAFSIVSDTGRKV